MNYFRAFLKLSLLFLICFMRASSGQIITNPSAPGVGGTPAGSNGDVQLNNSGAFGAARLKRIPTDL